MRDLSQHGHEVNEAGGEVEPRAVFTGGVVVWECVVVVMEAFADGAHRHKSVFARVDRVVVRLVAPHVGGAVHQPRHVKDEDVAQNGREAEGYYDAFAPEVAWHKGGEDEAHEYHGGKIDSKNNRRSAFRHPSIYDPLTFFVVVERDQQTSRSYPPLCPWLSHPGVYAPTAIPYEQKRNRASHCADQHQFR